MSQLTLFSSGAQLPAYLKSQELDAVTKALMGSTFNSKRISIKGGVFRMVVNGEEVAQSDDRAMNLIIINAAPKVARTFYMEKYVEGSEKKPVPTCWSHDGDKPDPQIKKPVSANCQTCPNNIKGSGDNDTRACRFSQRIAVMLENDMQGDVYSMTLPATSIFGADPNKMPLQQYGRFLGSHGVRVGAVVTEVRFDTSVSTPKVTFKAVRPLEEEEYNIATEKGQSPEAIQAITTTVAQQDGIEGADTGEAPEEQAQSPAPTPAPKAAPKPAPTPAPATAKPSFKATPKTNGFNVVKGNTPPPEAEVVAEPTVRVASTPAQPDNNVMAILDTWADD